MKEKISMAAGLIGGAISAAFGGFDTAMGALLVFMGIDYITGVMAAGIFHASPKASGGGLESRVGWKGLVRKFATLMIVLAAYQMDRVLGIQYIRNAVIIGFCANETISIIENTALMGLPIPKILKNAVDLMRDKSDKKVP